MQAGTVVGKVRPKNFREFIRVSRCIIPLFFGSQDGVLGFRIIFRHCTMSMKGNIFLVIRKMSLIYLDAKIEQKL